MFKNPLNLVVFAVGLAAVGWVGFGYLGSNPLGLAVALLIAACYLAGFTELLRFGQATATLTTALRAPPAAESGLAAWLERVHPSLRQPVRLRIEGARTALPGPALTPYLVGLLVLLGMLGTLLGMMATLRGTGIALESASDLQAVRESLAAPVKGLGFAFGTSIAGVATSAMLGLLSSLVRRDRALAVQQLDAQIATHLRPYSPGHQREQTFQLLQRQADLLPVLIDRLQAMADGLQQQDQAHNARQLAQQEAFHARAEAAQAQLATHLEHSVQASVVESSRAAGTALQPALESILAALVRHNAALHTTVAEAVDRQLHELNAGFVTQQREAAGAWQQAARDQQQAHAEFAARLHDNLAQAEQRQEQRAQALLDALGSRLDGSAERVAAAWQHLLAQQERINTGLETSTRGIAATWEQATAEQRLHNQQVVTTLGERLNDFGQQQAQRADALIDGLASRLDGSASALAAGWEQALARQEQAHRHAVEQQQQALAGAATAFEQHGQAMLERLARAQDELRQAQAGHEQQRLQAWTGTLEAMSEALRQDWHQAGEQAGRQQQQVCDALAKAATDIAAQGQAHASATIAEISQLVQVASEAPRAAAEVVAELRQKLSDSMVRDTAMLEERNRLVATLETLLGAVSHASQEQRAAIDTLVTNAAELLERAGTRFNEQIGSEAGRLDGTAAQIVAGVADVASLGEAFGAVVQQFGKANEKLATRLQKIEGALDKSLARSDEQLAYYVAQARELIELSVAAQQQLAREQAPALPGRGALPA